MTLKSVLKAVLPHSTCAQLSVQFTEFLAFRHRNDLTSLALLFGTDKYGSHFYTPHYQRYFYGLRKKPLNVLEIGVGGYASDEYGGASLRMWKAYFRKSNIVGIDICDKTKFCEPRIDIRKCDQTDSSSLKQLSDEYGGFDIIIDDGSHINDHVITTFQTLFPLLRRDGIYAIEDIQTAYWPSWGGGIHNPNSMMHFFKSVVDGLNHVDYPVENYQANYYDKHVVELAFFHNLILIRKGENNEKSNVPDVIHREIKSAS